MEPWLPVGEGGAGGGSGSGRRPSKGPASHRIPCRNFARGTCRWGQNCRFSHDRKSTQICRYFQNGFCDYGDRCSYQHVLEAPPMSRCSSEAAYHGLRGLTVNRRGSEPAILPEASVRTWGGARRGSEPAVSGMAQLQMNFGRMRMSFEEADEEDERAIPSWHPPNWALSKEFVPRQAASGSISHEERLDTTSLVPEEVSTKEAAPVSEISEEPKAAGSSEVAEAASASAEVQKSEDVVCGICMDKISQKTLPQERLFGILPNCFHAYCVTCIRKWRKSRDFHNAVIKGCPECRVTSTYFIPNQYWVSDSEEKEKLIENFKARTSKIRCKFFVRSNGQCPFKSECIYLHELPEGRLPAAKPQQRPERRRRRPVAYTLSPSDSSDEDEDMYFIQWALTVALLQRERDFDYSDFLIWDSSDSSD